MGTFKVEVRLFFENEAYPYAIAHYSVKAPDSHKAVEEAVRAVTHEEKFGGCLKLTVTWKLVEDTDEPKATLDRIEMNE